MKIKIKKVKLNGKNSIEKGKIVLKIIKIALRMIKLVMRFKIDY